MQTGTRLQDDFLDEIIENNSSVCIYLLSGVRLDGHISDYDYDVIMLETRSTKQIIYKRSICTILPIRQSQLNKSPT